MTTTSLKDETPAGSLRQCTGSDYGLTVASKRVTPQHTVAIDDGLWKDCLKISRKRHETLTTVIKQHLVRYRARHRDLLDEDN